MVEREFVKFVGPGVGIEVTGLEIIGRIDFGASAPTGWMTSTALVLETASGVVAAIPVNLFCGLPQIVVLGQPIEAQIGRSTRFSARVALPSGAPPVALTLDAADGPVTVPPKPVAVSGAVHAVVELNLLLSVAARPGLMEAHLTVDGFAGEEFRVPFKIRAVLPPPPPDPVDPPANFAAINDLWRAHRAEKGPFGHPLAKAERIGNVFLRKFAGEIIKSINAQASVADRQYVRVQLAGYTCISKTVNSPFGNDEPYFIVGAAASNGSVTRLFGPYDVEYDGTEQTISFELAGRELALVPPVTLVLIGFEHDNGNPREAEEKARVIISGIPSKLTSVTDPSSAEVDSHVVAQWLRDLGIGSIFEAVTAILGIGDDPIGRDVKPVYDEIPALIDRRQYPIIGKFQSEFPYTHILGVGGSNGSYILYFKVDLVTDS